MTEGVSVLRLVMGMRQYFNPTILVVPARQLRVKMQTGHVQ
jgi:hypothetical protein